MSQPNNLALTQIAQAVRGKEALKARCADVTKEHRERIKRLDQVIEMHANATLDDPLKLNVGQSLSPELLRLLEDPANGL